MIKSPIEAVFQVVSRCGEEGKHAARKILITLSQGNTE
jgi:hypothetical protein